MQSLTSLPNQPIVITPGEPSGIGPDLIVQSCQQQWSHPLVVIGDPELLMERAKLLGLHLTWEQWHPQLHLGTQQPPGHLFILPITLATKAIPGELDKRNATYVIDTLTAACRGCLNKQFSAMVTGPVHKGIINDAGLPFSGHTEFLAQQCASKKPVMVLQKDNFRVALVTTHHPLRAIPALITDDNLSQTIEIVAQGLQDLFAIKAPKLFVLGLNPHSGENGHLGREELDIIIPTLEKLRKKGYTLIGPLAADTAFSKENIKAADCFITMYHDQGLPVLKALGLGEIVNLTLGLPIIRTSVDHGVALDCAGTGKANPNSLLQAIALAQQLTANPNAT